MNPQSSCRSSKISDLELAREYARRLRTRLGDNLLGVTLFGSRARGTAQDGSDFDLIVVVRQRDAETRESVLDIDVEMMNEFEELFSGILFSEVEWTQENCSPFGWNVARDGVPL